MDIPEKIHYITLSQGLKGIAAPCGGEDIVNLTGRNDFPVTDWDSSFRGKESCSAHAIPVFLCGECTSTFEAAWKLHSHDTLPAWGSVIATTQSQGRGQMRRAWHSPVGNVYVSFRLPDSLLITKDLAPLITGYLLLHALQAVLGNIPLHLKWPNDLLLTSAGQEYKVGGILLEERHNALVAGFGLNLRHAPAQDILRQEHAASATVLNMPSVFPALLWCEMLAKMDAHYADIRQLSMTEYAQRIESVLAWKGRDVCVVDEEEHISGILCGITAEGSLRLRHAAGESTEHSSGSLRLAKG